MRLVTIEEYNELKPIVEKEMIELAKHENKNSYTTQVAINNCYVRMLSNNVELYQIFSPGFISVIENDYINALKENTESFGTYNAKDIIHALYIQAKRHNWVWNEERYTDYLSNETFCLLLCKKKQKFCDDIIRIDLFRKIKESKEKPGKFEFVGGIFHALKHYSVNGQAASILPNQNVSLYDIEQLVWPIAKAFYEGIWQKGKKEKSFETCTTYLNKLFTLEFFKEDGSNVSFVNTIIPKSI